MIGRNDPEFLPSRREGDGLLPWVIGVMLFLSALALAFSITLTQGLDDWSEDLSTTLSVQIIAEDTNDRIKQKDAAVRLLRATPGVTNVTVLADAEVMALLTPFLGDIPVDSDLPVPTLIDVTLRDPLAVNTAALGERLQATASGASLDDHKAWLRQILSLAGVLQLILIGIILMVGGCTVAIIIFGCRAGLATHSDSIDIMHMMGAEDALIARAFDRRYLVHGLLGAFGGVLLAGLALIGLSILTAEIGQGLITAIIPNQSVILWLLALPFVTALLAAVTARLTVRDALQKMV